MPDLNRKKAPKREVVNITRRGSWGQVVYVHTLECGHQEERKRPAPTPTVACTRCVLAEIKNEELRQIPTQPSRDVLVDVADIIDIDASADWFAEEDANMIRAGLAANLDIPIESIDMIMSDDDGTLALDFVNIYLSSRDARRLSNRTPIIDIEDTE